MTIENMAARYRRTKPISYESTADAFNFILRIDGAAEMQKTDLGPVIMFSDGSQYLMATHKAEDKGQ